MKHWTIKTAWIALAMGMAALAAGPQGAQAQSMTDYQTQPPFVADVVPPNILIVMDNSGSMTNRACESANCGLLGGAPSTNTNFWNATTYSGFFDTMSCYIYDATDSRFEPSSIKASISAACGSTEWDGNFLNWSVFRRFDAVKKAMIGNDCVVARAADGSCPPTGAPALSTVKAQGKFDGTSEGHETTPSIPLTGTATKSSYVGRVPVSVAQGGTGSNPNDLWIHLRGGTSGMQGRFCVDNDNNAPGSTETACNRNGNNTDGDSYNETANYFQIRIALSGPAEGVIHQIGSKARFGLAVFNNSTSLNGMRVLTGIGSRQSIDFTGSTVETFNTNTAAMVDAVEEAWPATWTPLSESLYEAVRYVAQINSQFYPSSYVYPIAFSGAGSNGVNFGSSGVGSLGPSEIKATTGTETCPSQYIADACGRDPFFYGSNHTPAWASNSTEVRCCKTFIMIFTDGEPTQDLGVPAVLQSKAAAISGVPCVGGSGTIHAPNGTCNTNPNTPASILLGEHKTDYGSSGSHHLNDVAYWAHTSDLRQATVPDLGVAGHDLPGIQNVTVYTFFAFGTIAGRELMMHAAQQGGFEDSNSNQIPDLPIEWDKVNNRDGTTGSTVAGCNADCIPDTYFESSNIDDLQDRLLAALTAILRKSASGSSVSVLASSVTGDGALYQAYFYVSDIGVGGNDVKWLGFTEGLFVDRYGNLREDTVQDGRLVLKEDLIITTKYDDDPSSPYYGKVVVNKYLDANGDGLADSATPTVANQGLRDIKAIWEAGKRLALATSASRKLTTWVDLNNDKMVDAGEQMDFSTTNSVTLAPYLRATASGVNTADNIINFVRGDAVAGMRFRTMQVQDGATVVNAEWKFGDPIHSPPTLVGRPRARFDLAYGDSSYNTFYQQYLNRRQVIYVGANDGMLHAFNAGYYHNGDDPTTPSQESGWFTKNTVDNSSGKELGEELFAYVPYELLPQLRFLTQVDYTHVYYVDLKPRIADVRIFTPDADHPDGWGTILIGGFRMGGSCAQCQSGTGAPPMTVNISGTNRNFYSAYFVLDITNPEVMPKLLWSFSDAGLGLSTSVPTVARVNPTADATTSNTNARWYAIFGSGPNGYNADLSAGTQTAKLYALDLKAGPGVNNGQVTTMPIGSWKSYISDVTAIDRDGDYRADMAYMGRTIHDGALPWRGKLYRLNLKGCATAPCSPSTWGVPSGANRTPSEMLDTFLDGASTLREMGPMMSQPVATVDDGNDNWVFFGTGRYYASADKVSTDPQYLFGVKDSVASGLCAESGVVSCHDDDLVDVTNAVLCLTCSNGNTNEVTGVGGAPLDFQSMISLVQSKRGWFAKLKTVGERSIVTPTLIGGIILFPSFTPTLDYCANTGNSRLYALFYKTGTASKDPVLGTTSSGGNTNSNTSVDLGAGLASSVVVQIIGAAGAASGGGGGGDPPCNSKFLHQNDQGAIGSPCGNVGKMYSRYLTWLHQRD